MVCGVVGVVVVVRVAVGVVAGVVNEAVVSVGVYKGQGDAVVVVED